MEVQSFLNQVLAGLSNGGIYAGIALALVMVYQSTHHINFAQGEMAVFSTLFCWTLLNAGWGYWSAALVTVAGSFTLGVITQRVIVRRVDDAPVLNIVAVFIGLLILFNSLAGWLFGHTIRTFPSPFSKAWALEPYLSAHHAGSLTVTFCVLLGMFAFFRFTKLGLSMRAAAHNPISSQLSGISVARMVALGWGVAAAVGAVAAMLAAPLLYLEPNMMMGVLLYGFAGALLGGISNPWGAALGGVLIGILENLAGAYLVGTDLKQPLALAVIFAVLILRPAGIWGQQPVNRV